MSIALPRRAAGLHARKDPAVDPLMMRQGVATRANAVFMVLLFNALLAPPAFACKPLVPEWQVREFLATKPAGGALAFSGTVRSVATQVLPDGREQTDMVLLPVHWRLGHRDGPMTVRTVVSRIGPCPGLGALGAKVGEQWLLVGPAAGPTVMSWMVPAAGIRLEHGRLPPAIERALQHAAAHHAPRLAQGAAER